MAKYHINAKGVPAACRARVKPCPFGGADGTENHFSTKEEAQKFADKNNEQQFGMIDGLGDKKPKKDKALIKKEVEIIAGNLPFRNSLDRGRPRVDVTNKEIIVSWRDPSLFESNPFDEDDDWPEFTGDALVSKELNKHLKKYGDSVFYEIVGEEKSWISVYIKVN